MKIQLIGLGNVGKSLVGLIAEKKKLLKTHGYIIDIVSVSDQEEPPLTRMD